jgi:hypothetical protein
VELLNSPIEAVIERYGPEFHELAGRAKDMGSAAVFVLMLNFLLVWGLILGPRYLKRGAAETKRRGSDVRLVGRPAGLAHLVHAERDRDRARHRQPGVHFDRGQQAAAREAREGAQVRHRGRVHHAHRLLLTLAWLAA